jgi:hypothetical protein
MKMGTSMSDPLLDMFKPLSSGYPDIDPKTYPGTTPPRNAGKVLDRVHDDWLSSLPSQEWKVGDSVRKFYSIGTLAAVLQRSPTTVRSWESKGWIPPASFRAPAPRKEQIPGKALRGKRLYSEAQVRFLYEASVRFHLAIPRQADWPGFRRHVKTKYPTT